MIVLQDFSPNILQYLPDFLTVQLSFSLDTLSFVILKLAGPLLSHLYL